MRTKADQENAQLYQTTWKTPNNDNLYLQSTDHVKQQISFSSKDLSLANEHHLAIVEHEPVVALSRVANVVTRVDLALVYDDGGESVDQAVGGRVHVVI